MNIDHDMLEMSHIGRPIMFLRKHPLETPENREICEQLFTRWSAHIFTKDKDRAQRGPLVATSRPTKVPPSFFLNLRVPLLVCLSCFWPLLTCYSPGRALDSVPLNIQRDPG